jgi:hypothetical protein
MIVPDGDVMSSKLLEAIEGAYRVEIIVENGDLHGALLLYRAYFTASN